jgi:hypothetical protein
MANHDHPGESGTKVAAVTIAIVCHLLLAVGFLMIAPSVPRPNPPVIVATPPAPEPEEPLQKEEMTRPQSRKVSAAPAPSINVTTSQAFSPVPITTMDLVHDLNPGGLGITLGASMTFDGMGDSGDGGRFGFFGSRSGQGGLRGTLYDFKQRPDRSPSGIPADQTPDYKAILQRFVNSRFDARRMERTYFKAPESIQFALLAVPVLSADEGPKAFQAEEFIEPKAWMIHYSGEILAPETSRWRFVGGFDDAIIVFINNRLVFDGSWDNFMDEPECRVPFGNQRLQGHTPLFHGKWATIPRKGKIDIIVGERPGGKVGGLLMIQKKDGKYRKRQDGTPILPLFALSMKESALKRRIADFPYEIDPVTPPFSATSAVR